MIVTSSFLTALECIRFVFGRGSAPDFVGRAYNTPPDPLAALRGPTSNGEGNWKRGRGERVREGGGRERKVTAGTDPLTQIPGSAFWTFAR